MKAHELLTTDYPPPKISLLTGEDQTLKTWATKHLTQRSNHKEKDQQEIKSGNQLVDLIQDGSLFGSRLLIVDLNGKWGKTDQLLHTLKEFTKTEDTLIIRAEESPQKEEKPSPPWTEIECSIPYNRKTRAKLLDLRLPVYNLKTSEEAHKRILDRTETAADLESILTTLSLIVESERQITTRDIDRVFNEPANKKDLTRALIQGNIPRVCKEITQGEPAYVLTVLHNNLMKIFTWLECLSTEGNEKKAIELLKIPPRSTKDWKTIKNHYSSQGVRQALEAVSLAFDDFIGGRHGWEDRLQTNLRELI